MASTTCYASAIPLADKSTWTKYVTQSLKHDFYHTWDYQDLVKNGEPMLFVCEDDENFIAIPLTKRTIPNTDYCDFHSVYGYTGPISNADFNDISDEFIAQFQERLLQFLKEENAVSVFAKFHPFFNQTKAMQNMGGIVDNGRVVAIDLTQPIEIQRKRYKRTLWKDVVKARELGFTTRNSLAQQDIVEFTKLYNKSMDRIGASSSYRFDENYFTSLIHSSQCNAKFVLVYFQDRLVCGSVVTFNHGIIQAHLLATDHNYIQYSPAKYMNDEICLLGREHGMDYFHLGGGLGYKEDSLLRWKLNFSDLTLPHKSWRFVVNQEVYNDLVMQSGNDLNNTVDFFPLYRLNK